MITVKKYCSAQASTHLFSEPASLKSDIDSSTKGNLNLYGHEVEILGGCRVVYRPNASKCGAKVWIETLYDVKVICWE